MRVQHSCGQQHGGRRHRSEAAESMSLLWYGTVFPCFLLMTELVVPDPTDRPRITFWPFPPSLALPTDPVQPTSMRARTVQITSSYGVRPCRTVTKVQYSRRGVFSFPLTLNAVPSYFPRQRSRPPPPNPSTPPPPPPPPLPSSTPTSTPSLPRRLPPDTRS